MKELKFVFIRKNHVYGFYEKTYKTLNPRNNDHGCIDELLLNTCPN